MISCPLRLKIVYIKIITIAWCLCCCCDLFGQRDSLKLDELSLKDLLNVKIVSVSKNAELLFDAPLSASVLTRQEISRAGSTSIMEALRLVPGMIVREQSNGNYDIHLRGMDNVPPNAPFDVTSNTTTLVMIDNRPVYNYLRGGTFWETLPIDLNDVERIEVIRGPAAALYGPNAVNGVINIITRQAVKEGLYLVAKAQQGSNLTYINTVSAGYRFNKKLNIIASGNYQSRDRTELSYFEFYRKTALERPAYLLDFSGDTVRNINQRYPDQAMAQNKYGGNLFVNYQPAEKTSFAFSGGGQHSVVQKVSTENETTPLSTASSDSRYANLRANIHGFSAQFSYNGGTQATEANPGRKYDFSITGGNIEYNFTKSHFSLKPGLSYTSAVYDDRKYSDLALKTGMFNARGSITAKTASLHAEYKLLDDRLRLVAGFAANTFNHPDTTYMAYELAATYKFTPKHLVRMVWSRAPRSANVFDTYVAKTIAYFPTGNNRFGRLQVEGDPNNKLLTADMFEAGYRGRIARDLIIDVELFDVTAKNYTTPVVSRPYTVLSGADTVDIQPIRSTNLPAIIHQKGVTFSLTWNSKKWQAKPFMTLQYTTAHDYAPFINMPDAGTPGAQQNNIYSGTGTTTKIESTPTVFGGGYLNYILLPSVNINISAYYYSPQIYYHVSNVVFNDGVRGIDHISGKLILNTSVSYMPVKGLRLFCSGKNLLNNHSREFFHTDKVPFMILAGLNYEL